VDQQPSSNRAASTTARSCDPLSLCRSATPGLEGALQPGADTMKWPGTRTRSFPTSRNTQTAPRCLSGSCLKLDHADRLEREQRQAPWRGPTPKANMLSSPCAWAAAAGADCGGAGRLLIDGAPGGTWQLPGRHNARQLTTNVCASCVPAGLLSMRPASSSPAAAAGCSEGGAYRLSSVRCCVLPARRGRHAGHRGQLRPPSTG
jgi:hypothetical protein